MKKKFFLYFRPSGNGIKSVNMLPDFLPARAVKITALTINGEPAEISDPYNFQIQLKDEELDSEIAESFMPVAGLQEKEQAEQTAEKVN